MKIIKCDSCKELIDDKAHLFFEVLVTGYNYVDSGARKDKKLMEFCAKCMNNIGMYPYFRES